MITLGEVSALATRLLEEERELELMELAVSAKKERIRSLKEESIPCAMKELGLEEMVLTTGEKVKVGQEVYASIPADQKKYAFDWLEQHGFGGLIKTELKIEFGRDSIDEFMSLRSELIERGLNPESKRDVHGQTLKAFIKEQLATAENFPLDLFGARCVDNTKITVPKVKALKKGDVAGKFIL